jgi:hypothetical protein
LGARSYANSKALTPETTLMEIRSAPVGNPVAGRFAGFLALGTVECLAR